MRAEIPEDAVAEICFSEHDAVLLTDQTQVEFLAQHANKTFERCHVFPLSMQAYAAALRSGHGRVHRYFECVDFADCQRKYNFDAQELARSWLGEIGLRCEIEGIDLAQMDKPNQFLLFLLAWYLEGTAERLLEAHPEIETCYLVGSEEPLTLDFYFDSDVPTGVLRYVCESKGREVQLIKRSQHRYLFSPYPKRPMTRTDEADAKALTPARTTEGRRAGFVPATVTSCQQILDALAELQYETLLFDSTWGMPPLFRGLQDRDFQLTDRAGAATSERQAKLRALWSEIEGHLESSRLPASLVRNPYLAYQLEYIVTERWLSYANMIERAKAFAETNPLDIFIQPDTFTAEGAILASFYRRNGTPMVIAAHTSWPCDPNWSARERSDLGLVNCRSAGRRLRELSGMETQVTGTAAAPIYKSVLRKQPADDRATERKSKAGNRKLVVIVTNALELLCVPFVDAIPHFETMMALASVPEHLRDRVMVAIRTKPRPLGEDPILYEKLCGFPEESLAFLDGLNFSESVQVADCVMGVNVPTTGYFEIMERGVPLIHVQTAESLMLHPDLPAEVTARVTRNEAIWPALEAVLFDSTERAALIEIQRCFIAADQAPEPGGLKDILRRITGKRGAATENPASVARHWGELRMSEGRGAGHVDDVLVASDGTAAVRGWAADMVQRTAAKAMHVFADGVRLASGPVCGRRPDVAQALGDTQLQNAGFWVRVPGCDADRAKQLAFCAELWDGSYSEIPNPAAEG